MYFSFKRAAKIHPFSDIYGYGKRITRARFPLYFLHTHARHNKSSQRYADCLLIWAFVFPTPNRVEYFTYVRDQARQIAERGRFCADNECGLFSKQPIHHVHLSYTIDVRLVEIHREKILGIGISDAL